MTSDATQPADPSAVDRTPKSDFLTLPEAMAASRYSRSTLLRAIYEKKLRSAQRGIGRQHRIHKDDLRAWMNGEQPTGRRRGPRAA